MKRCQVCKIMRADKSIKRRRQNTSYVEQEKNFTTCCYRCFKIGEEYWQEQWNDYYADCM